MTLPAVRIPTEVFLASSDIIAESAFMTIGDRVRMAKSVAVECWRIVKQRSAEYAAALAMCERDIDDLEHLKGIVVVRTAKGEIFLTPKNTCGCPYGDTWHHLLQARSPNRPSIGIGGGTTFIAALNPEIHGLVMKAIRLGQTEVRQGQIWP